MCHQMSGSAIARAETAKIAATSRNMHITGKEKTLAARRAAVDCVSIVLALAVGRMASDGDCEMVSTANLSLLARPYSDSAFNGAAAAGALA